MSQSKVKNQKSKIQTWSCLCFLMGFTAVVPAPVTAAGAATPPPAPPVEGQPLAANVERLAQALEFLGAPLPGELRAKLGEAGRRREAGRLQELLDPGVLLVVRINPEARVKVERGPAPAA